jgi:Flp pilus assembly pilin Flp
VIQRLLQMCHRLNSRLGDESGQTTLEWVLLLAVIALPGYAILRMALAVLVSHYGLITTLNALPMP